MTEDAPVGSRRLSMMRRKGVGSAAVYVCSAASARGSSAAGEPPVKRREQHGKQYQAIPVLTWNAFRRPNRPPKQTRCSLNALAAHQPDTSTPRPSTPITPRKEAPPSTRGYSPPFNRPRPATATEGLPPSLAAAGPSPARLRPS